jgi:hypothetical protein
LRAASTRSPHLQRSPARAAGRRRHQRASQSGVSLFTMSASTVPGAMRGHSVQVGSRRPPRRPCATSPSSSANPREMQRGAGILPAAVAAEAPNPTPQQPRHTAAARRHAHLSRDRCTGVALLAALCTPSMGRLLLRTACTEPRGSRSLTPPSNKPLHVRRGIRASTSSLPDDLRSNSSDLCYFCPSRGGTASPGSLQTCRFIHEKTSARP